MSSTITILGRNIKWRFHNAFTIVITILQPLLWLVLYSNVAGAAMKESGVENYTAFIMPGLIVLISFAACSSSGIMNYLMKAEGSFYRILIAPIKRSSIVLGQILEAVLCSFLEVAIMVLFSFFFSVRIAAGPAAILVLFVLMFLTVFFMAGLCYAISMILPNEIIYETVMNAIVLPVFFLSSALFPVESMAGGVAVAVRLNPFTHVIDVMRSLILNGTMEPSGILPVMLLYIVLGAVSFSWALSRLKKETLL